VTALKDYLDMREPKPSPETVLVLGQDIPYDGRYDNNVLLTVGIATKRALEDSTKAGQAVSKTETFVIATL
jgi:hypothetical protein